MKFYTAESPLLVDGSRVEAGEHVELTDEMAGRLLQLGRVKEAPPAVQKSAAQAKQDSPKSEGPRKPATGRGNGAAAGGGEKSPKPPAKAKASKKAGKPANPPPQQPAPEKPAPEATNPPENETGGETTA